MAIEKRIINVSLPIELLNIIDEEWLRAKKKRFEIGRSDFLIECIDYYLKVHRAGKWFVERRKVLGENYRELA